MAGGGREKKEPSLLIFLLLMCVSDEVEWVSVSVSLHSDVEQVPQIWVIWGLAEEGVMDRAEEANTESWSWEQLREGGCSWPSSVPCLFVLILFLPIREQSTGADTECDLRGLAALCLQEDLKPSGLVCALISCWSCCSQWAALPAPVFSGLYSCSVWVFLHCWRCFPHFSFVCLGPGMVEHKISLCSFLCHQYATISLWSENTYGYQ